MTEPTHEALARIREAVEMYCWDHSRHQEGREYCICCSAWMTDGHKPDCTIGQALRDVDTLAAALTAEAARVRGERDAMRQALEEIQGLLVIRPHRFADQTEKIHAVIDRALVHAKSGDCAAPVDQTQTTQAEEVIERIPGVHPDGCLCQWHQERAALSAPPATRREEHP